MSPHYVQVIIQKPFYEQLFYVLFTVVPLTGTPLMVLVIYFFILGKTKEDWSWGLSFIVRGFFVHYIVVGVTAHAAWYVYIPLQLMELAALIAIIRYWHRTKRGNVNNLQT
jgi:hypothetical protein